MAGNDNYTKLLLHCDGIDASTSFPDASAEDQIVTAINTAQVDTAQSKFGGGSALLTKANGDYLDVTHFSELNTGSNDFTYDFWVRINAPASSVGLINRGTDGNSFYMYVTGGNIAFRDRYNDSDTIFISRSYSSFSQNTWYHIAVVRSGTTVRIFQDGIQLGASATMSGSLTSRTDNLNIGGIPWATWYTSGWIEEFRFSPGIARWTSNFTPPTAPYSGLEKINETVTLDDEWDIQASALQISLVDTVTVSDEWDIQTNQRNIDINETVTLDDEWTFDVEGDIKLRYLTNLRTLIQNKFLYMTNLIVNILQDNVYYTNLRTRATISNTYETDLRVKIEDDVNPGNLNDIIVKLDGTELTDVDYSTLNITYNLNNVPSLATFKLARRHDNFNYLLDGVTYSEIDNENKIEIYDGDDKLLTAYITQIETLSETDTISVIAEDIRYQLSRNSMEIEYGAKMEVDDDNPDKYNVFEKSVGTVLNEVFSAINSYISGHESVPFPTTYTPEYTKTYNSYSSLLDTLITQTANVNWYIDENEYLRFQKVESGTIKELNLSSLDGKRYVYDVILDNISMSKQRSGYTQSLNVKLGTHFIQSWSRRVFSGWLNSYVDFYNSLKEKTSFCFQQWGQAGRKWYCGINKTIYGYSNEEWVLKPTIVVQYVSKDSSEDLPDVTIGSGLPQRTIYLNSYGKKESSVRWEERIKSSDSKPYLTYVTDETYDNRNFALDFAYFDLSQNNKLQTSGTITLLLNAFKYYNIKLKDRINLSNTISSSIYKNNNGFPLNVNSISINCATRLVTLNVTNYGKSWGVKTANYLTNATAPKVRYVQVKENVIRYSSGV